MNLWDRITSSSTLPVQAGTTLWDHLNNLGGNAVGGLVPIPYSDVIIEDQVAVMTVTDYSDAIVIVEAEVPTIVVVEQLTILSFEE